MCLLQIISARRQAGSFFTKILLAGLVAGDVKTHMRGFTKPDLKQPSVHGSRHPTAIGRSAAVAARIARGLSHARRRASGSLGIPWSKEEGLQWQVRISRCNNCSGPIAKG